jgi:diguanylate cyclase (GGDEF)-like protein
MQGGDALIYRKPIEVNNQYWGLFSIVIDIDSFLAELGSERLLTQGTLAVVAAHGDGETILYGDKAALSHPARQSVDVAVPGGHWHLVLVPKVTEDSTVMVWRFFGWGIALLLGGGVGTILLQRSALQGLALIDELTGVANRRQFDLMLERFCEKYERRDSGSFALLYVDLDRFKEINDTHGHRAGDFFLVEVAKRIRQATRGGDLLARWGGDEFALLLDNPSQASIDRVVKRVRELVEQPVLWRDSRIQVGASIGVVRYPEDGTTPEALLGHADQRMYSDKNMRREQT